MLIDKSPAKIIEQNGITARIYRLQQGYRVEVNQNHAENPLYWHPQVFNDERELSDWLKPQLEALIDNGVSLSGRWMKSEISQLYQDWFIRETVDSWEGYDPMTNRCHRASTLEELHEEIDRIEAYFCCS